MLRDVRQGFLDCAKDGCLDVLALFALSDRLKLICPEAVVLDASPHVDGSDVAGRVFEFWGVAPGCWGAAAERDAGAPAAALDGSVAVRAVFRVAVVFLVVGCFRAAWKCSDSVAHACSARAAQVVVCLDDWRSVVV